jgi:hypothetical protein
MVKNRPVVITTEKAALCRDGCKTAANGIMTPLVAGERTGCVACKYVIAEVVERSSCSRLVDSGGL